MDTTYLDHLIDRYDAVSFTVNRKLNALIRDQLDEDLTLDQFATLRYIKKKGRCTSTELADAFYVGKSAITAIITRLVDKRYIHRTSDGKDRRIIYLSLSPDGERVYDVIQKRIQELMTSFLKHFEPAEINAFIVTYEKLARVIVEDEREGRNG